MSCFLHETMERRRGEMGRRRKRIMMGSRRGGEIRNHVAR